MSKGAQGLVTKEAESHLMLRACVRLEGAVKDNVEK